MNKAEFTEALMASSASKDLEKLSKAGVERVANACFEVMANALSDGESIAITGFGTLEVKTRQARVRVNPQTKEKFMAPAGKTVKFRVGSALRNRLNG